MGILALLLVLGPDEESLGKKLLPLYQKEAAGYSLAVETAPKTPLELKPEPVFEWSNPIRGGGQHGAVFVWLREGRPAALGCFFSTPAPEIRDGLRITHELHALDPEKLVVGRPGWNRWKPESGLARAELPGAGAPAESPAARLPQMRRLAQEYTGYSVDPEGKRWELRLLPAPLYRYPAAKAGVVDGALFALVSNAGTDPEVLLLVEAKEDGGRKRWEYACGRFSDWDLHVRRKDQEVWASVRSQTNPVTHDPKHTYRIYPDKIVTADGKLLALLRPTEQKPDGELVPVEDK